MVSSSVAARISLIALIILVSEGSLDQGREEVSVDLLRVDIRLESQDGCINSGHSLEDRGKNLIVE